jgi:hypothetical protein
MNNFDFGAVLTRAWQIIWKHKVLWIFGILAGCGTSRGNFNNSLGDNSSYQADGTDFSGLSPEMQRQAEQFVRYLEQVNWASIVIVVFALICVIMLAAIFLSTIGRIGLIKGAAQVEAGREALAFGELWSESLPYFWRVFWLNFLAGLPFFLLIMAIAIGGLFAAVGLAGAAEATNIEEWWVGLLPLMGGMVFLMCCIGLASMVLQFIVNQAYNAIILEERGIVEGFTRGWEVITKNIGPMLLMGVILYIIQLVLGFILAIPAFIILLPILVGGIAAGTGAGGFAAAPLALGVLCLCLYAPIAWVITGVLEAYTQSAWTLTFLRLTVQPPAPAAPALEIAQTP